MPETPVNGLIPVYDTRKGVVQTRVTLLAKHHKAKAFRFIGSSLLSTGKSVTLRLGKLNHAKKIEGASEYGHFR